MSGKSSVQSILAAGGLFIACVAVGQPNTPGDAAGADVPKGWWSAVQKDIAQSEYNVTCQEETAIPGLGAAWQAPNRAQNLRMYFTEEGLRVARRTQGSGDWTWGLELTSIGGAGTAAAPPPVQDACAEGNRVTFRRGNMDEWYVNGPAGLEQGFTVYRLPASGNELVVQMAVRGGLPANKTAAGDAVEFLSADGVGVIRCGGLAATDASGRALPTAISLDGDAMVELRADTAGAVYPVTIQSLTTSAFWTAESNQLGALFGTHASTAGDVNGDGYGDVIVSAPYFDNGETDEGRAFVYYGSASGLYPMASWTAEGNQAQAKFGSSVATAGDVNGDGYGDVIVGADLYDNGETDEGRVYVYHGSVAGLSATAGWTAESNVANSYLGVSVSTAGDVNGDGFSDVIIGASKFTNGEADEGGAFVYYGSAAGLSAAPDWQAEGNQNSACFGVRVSTAGDVNGDGLSDVAVGAHEYSNGQSYEGRAFVYHGSKDGLPAKANWTAESNQANALFGFSLSTAGDVNGDGYADVLVGAPNMDYPETDEGRAFLYLGSASGLLSTPAWTADSDQGSAFFGDSVSTAGDVNGDGYADVIVGAPSFDNGQTNEGGVFLYLGSASGLALSPAWTEESDQAGAYLGRSVSAAGDVNGDGYAEVIVGAPYFDNGQPSEGRVFVYHGSPSSLSPSAVWTAEGDQENAYFGTWVSTAGDVNGDGYADVIVGASHFDNGQSNEGRAFVYHGSTAGLSPAPDWMAESNQANARFGTAVSTAGDVNSDGYADVIVAAPGFDGDQPDEGRVFVYHGSAAGLSVAANWTVDGNQDNANLGGTGNPSGSVSAAGDVNGDGYGDVIIGASLFDTSESSAGRVFVYHGSAAGLSLTASWTADGGQVAGHFGESVSGAGDVNGDGYSDVIIGAPQFENVSAGEGGAFLYQGSAAGLSATPDWTAEGNQEYAEFGASVSTAGDVNGDGYSDVLVGAPFHDNDLEDQGSVFLYYGSAAGLSAVAGWIKLGDQVLALLGHSVCTAGDVNGDGYADVIVGQPGYSNGQTNEGRVCLYLGSTAGLSTASDWTMESNRGEAWFGQRVSTAGDVNGDGYADVTVGAHRLDNGAAAEGAAFLYYGNGEAGGGLSLRPRQRRADDTVMLSPMGMTAGSEARLALLGRTPFGRSKVKLECEVKQLGTPFDGTGTVKTVSWTNTGTAGAALNQLVAGLYPGAVHHWRVRLLYHPAVSPFQQYSRWFTIPSNGWEEGDFRVYAPPITGSILINNNRSATNNRNVTLALTWSGGAGTGVVRMRFSDDGAHWSAWEPLAATRAHTMPEGPDGHRTVRVQYLDKLNNRSDVFHDYIRLDTTPPTGTIIINGGALTTTTRSVTLGLTWVDAGATVTRMRFSDDGAHWSWWMLPETPHAYTLPEGLGYHTVRVQYLDGAGNYSAVTNDYIRLVAP